MIIIFKKIIQYLLFLLPWYIAPIIFKPDYTYYRKIKLPPFAPSSIVFILAWTILYFLISYTIYIVWNKKDIKYIISLLINYISNQLYIYFFFNLKNISLSLIDTIIVLISSIFLYIYTKEKDNTVHILLIPYILWNIFATILSISIYILNK